MKYKPLQMVVTEKNRKKRGKFSAEANQEDKET